MDFSSSINMLVNLSCSGTIRKYLNSKIKFNWVPVPPEETVQIEITYGIVTQILHSLPRQRHHKVTPDIIWMYLEDKFIQQKDWEKWGIEITSLPQGYRLELTVKVHCECNLLAYIDQNPQYRKTASRHIGCPKLSCYLCTMFINAFNAVKYDHKQEHYFYMLGSHGKAYPLWKLVDTVSIQVAARLLQDLWNDIFTIIALSAAQGDAESDSTSGYKSYSEEAKIRSGKNQASKISLFSYKLTTRWYGEKNCERNAPPAKW